MASSSCSKVLMFSIRHCSGGPEQQLVDSVGHIEDLMKTLDCLELLGALTLFRLLHLCRVADTDHPKKPARPALDRRETEITTRDQGGIFLTASPTNQEANSQQPVSLKATRMNESSKE